MPNFLEYFLNGDLQQARDPGDPSMPYGPPLWPMREERLAADTGRYDPRRVGPQHVWPWPQPSDLPWAINSADRFEVVAGRRSGAPEAAPQEPERWLVAPDIPLWAQQPPTARITVTPPQQNGNGKIPPMPLQPRWPQPPWPEPQMDTSWLDDGPLAAEANTVAARKVSRAMRPPGGRIEGPLTSLPEELLIPKTPLDWAMYATGGPLSPMRLGTKAMMLGLGAALQPTDAQAGPTGKFLSAFGVVAERSRFPGIYKDGRQIAQEVAALAVPEKPEMKRLFRVDRDDLFEMSKRTGNQVPVVFPSGSRGSEHAALLTNQLNADRIVAPMVELQKLNPDIYKGMVAFFPMDPAYHRLVELGGKEEGGRLFDQFNTFTGLASPGSRVDLEFNRGGGAYYLNRQGRFSDFFKHGGVAQRNRGESFPADMTGIAGHWYHDPAHITPMQKYVDTGALDMQSVKVPVYIPSSGVPERSFQTQFPVGDVHTSRGIGLADVRRKATNQGRSMTRAELQTTAPWYEHYVGAPLGLNPIQAQSLQWGTFGPQTGVLTPIGATKLEILSQSIMDTARRLGISPEQARDKILLGEIYPAFGNVPMTPETFSGRTWGVRR
jgi:hypothetical protein